MILNFIYLLWLGGATLLGVLENIFMLFVGVVKPHEMGGYLDPNDASDTNWGQDITARVLGYRATQEIFFNLVAFATVMLIFFTIIQIIREHYKDKHGGNPYVLVFRMVKAMVLFMFVTAACVVGLRLSNIVLQALIGATGGGKNIGIGGIIFVAMAGQANRISQYSEGDITNIDNRDKFEAMSALDRDRDWQWIEFPVIWYGGNPDDLYEEDGDNSDATGEDTTQGEWVNPRLLNLPYGASYTGISSVPRGTTSNASRMFQIIRFDTNDLARVWETHWANNWVKAEKIDNNNARIRDALMHINVTATSGKIHRAPRYGANKAIFREHKGFFFLGGGDKNKTTNDYPLAYPVPVANNKPNPPLEVWQVNRAGNDAGGFWNTVFPWGANAEDFNINGSGGGSRLYDDSTWGYGYGNQETVSNPYHYYAITTDNRGKPINTHLRPYGMMSGSYYYFEHEKNKTVALPGGVSGGATLRNHYEANVEYYKGHHGASMYYSRQNDDSESFAMRGYANWVDNMMKRTRGVAKQEDDNFGSSSGDGGGYLWYYNDEGFVGINRNQKIGYMTYTNVRTVTFLYDIKDFNWIIGFGGLFIALGVFNSFAFGMIQRVAELAILYMFAPVTLAFFPFDDGAQFNNAFVKPFYKKAISSYAPVLSLNLFFAILPAFSNIDWVDPSSLGGFVMNSLISCIVTIALLSMLPKVRTTIQTMLGADPMDEKKMFGKGGVMSNALQKTTGVLTAPKAMHKYGVQKGMQLAAMGNAAKERKEARDQKRQKKVEDSVAAADRAHRAKTGKGLSDSEKSNLRREMSKTNKLGMSRMSARDKMNQAKKDALNADVAQRRGEAQGFQKPVRERDANGNWQNKLDEHGKPVMESVEADIKDAGVLARMRQRAENTNASRDKTIFGNERRDMQNMNADQMSKNQAYQSRGWEAFGKAAGMTDEQAKNFAADQISKGRQISDRQLAFARRGGKGSKAELRDKDGNVIREAEQGANANALQGKEQKMDSKVSKLQREIDAATLVKNKTDVVNAMGGKEFDSMVQAERDAAAREGRSISEAEAHTNAAKKWLVKNKGMQEKDAADAVKGMYAGSGDSTAALMGNLEEDKDFKKRYNDLVLKNQKLPDGDPAKMSDDAMVMQAAKETLMERAKNKVRSGAAGAVQSEIDKLTAEGRTQAVKNLVYDDPKVLKRFQDLYAKDQKEGGKTSIAELERRAAVLEHGEAKIKGVEEKGIAAKLQERFKGDGAFDTALAGKTDTSSMIKAAQKALEEQHIHKQITEGGLEKSVTRQLDDITKNAPVRTSTDRLKEQFAGDKEFEKSYTAALKNHGEKEAVEAAAMMTLRKRSGGTTDKDGKTVYNMTPSEAKAALNKMIKDGDAESVAESIKKQTLAQGVSEQTFQRYGKEWLGSDGETARNEARMKEVGKTTIDKEDVIAHEKRMRQKTLDDAAYDKVSGKIQNLTDEELQSFGLVERNKDGTVKKDAKGNLVIKKGQDLKDAYDEALRGDAQKDLRRELGLETTFEHDAKGIAGEALKVAGGVGKIAKFATNPWYAVDTMQGWANNAKNSTESTGSLLARGLAHIPGIGGALADRVDGKGISFGAIAGALFEPGYGALATSGFGKSMDQFSRYQVNKGYDELEKNRMERMEPDAFADSRVLRQAGVYYEREQTMKALYEGVSNVKTVYGGGDRDAQVRNFETAETNANRAIEASANVRLGGINDATKRKAVIDSIESAAKDYDEGSARENFRRNQYDAINKGTLKELEGIFGPALALSIMDARQRINDDTSKKEVLEQHHKTISSFQKVESLVRKDDGTLKTVQEVESEVAKRKSQLDEYAGIAGRVLGISEQTQGVLNAAKAKIVDFDGEYQKALKSVQDKKPYTMADGTVISNSSQLKPLQEATYAEYERVVRANVDFGAAASRDYAEKVGDRLDGYKGGKMASEQTKLMQETVKSSHRDTHQIFCDPEFVKLLESSRWAEIAAQLRKASNGEECVFERQTVAAAKKHELMGFANMFNDMMGDADGEMRGGSFAVANNMIAKQLRIAFVDQIDKSLEATANLIDREQETAFRQRNEQIQNGINKLSSGLGWEKDVYSSVNFQALDSLSFSDGAQITKMQKDMLSALEQSRRNGEIKDEYAYNNARRDIEQMFSATLQNLSKRHEGNLMLWRRRELREMDYVARCMMDRKDDKRAALPGGDNWFS